MLREITVIVRINKWKPTVEALSEVGFPAMTRQRVFGRGRQKGLRYASEDGKGGIAALPKWMLTLVVVDERVDAALGAIFLANRSGMIGDGKVFITRLEQVVRFLDGAEDREALGLDPPAPSSVEPACA